MIICIICAEIAGHGKDKERNDHLPSDEAMELAKKSYIGDIESGFGY